MSMMIAPRKKLWSTPDAVIEALMEAVPLSPRDRVVDIGCGDGRVLLRWATSLSEGFDGNSKGVVGPSFLGIDIDSERIAEAKASLKQLVECGEIHQSIDIFFICANALMQQSLLERATVFFLYLIPRGLRIVYPMLRQVLISHTNTHHHHRLDVGKPEPIRVATYMSPLLDETPDRVLKIAVPHQPGTHWPLYLYRLTLES